MSLPIELAPEVTLPRILFIIPVKNDMMKSYIPWMKASTGAKNDCPVGVAIQAVVFIGLMLAATYVGIINTKKVHLRERE